MAPFRRCSTTSTAGTGSSSTPAAPATSASMPSGGRSAARSSALREARTRPRPPAPRASLMRLTAMPRRCSGSSSRPSRTGSTKCSCSRARARVHRRRRPWTPPATRRCSPLKSTMRRCSSKSSSSCWTGSHEEREVRKGTGAPAVRSAPDSRSRTRRTSRIVFPVPGSPRTIRRRVGMRRRTSTSRFSSASSPGPAAHLPSRSSGRPGHVPTSAASESQGCTSSGSAGLQRTDSGWPRRRSRYSPVSYTHL